MNKYSVYVYTVFTLNWDASGIDIVDHFSLNQSRSEEITLKEEFGNDFLNLVDFGKDHFFPHVLVLPDLPPYCLLKNI